MVQSEVFFFGGAHEDKRKQSALIPIGRGRGTKSAFSGIIGKIIKVYPILFLFVPSRNGKFILF